jgi:hypothetical protein
VSGYLAIRNWQRYQHKDIFKKSRGRPPWIKFYSSLLDDDELSELELSTRLLFCLLLLLAARKRNAILNDSEWIGNKIEMQPELVAKGVATLLKGGWLSQTKTPRRSQLIRNSEALKGEKKLDNNPPNPLTAVIRETCERCNTLTDCTDDGEHVICLKCRGERKAS